MCAFRPRAALALLPLLASLAAAADKPAPKPDDARRAALLKAGYAAVPIVVDEGRLIVQAEVKGEKGTFLIDTGGQNPLVSLKLAKKLKLELGEEVQTLGAKGVSSGRLVDIGGLAFTGFDTRAHMNTFTALAADLSARGTDLSGVLGMNALDPFAPVIDLPGKTLYLRPPLATLWPKVAGKWQVTTWKDEETPRELDAKSPPTAEFVNNRLKLTDGTSTREFAVHTLTGEGDHQLFLFDPKQKGKTEIEYSAAGLMKLDGKTMTACLALDLTKTKELPTEFIAPKGSGHTVLVMKDLTDKRAAPEDPVRKVLEKDGYTAVPLERAAGGERAVTAVAGKEKLRLHVETAATGTFVDAAKLKKMKAKVIATAQMATPNGPANVDVCRLRGLTLGGYDTRGGWMGVDVVGADYAPLNEIMKANKLPAVHGALGQSELSNGSAVIDLHADTLYLRHVKKELSPKLEGKWVAVRWEEDGKGGRYTAGDGPTAEFTADRHTFTRGADKEEWGYQVFTEAYHLLGLFDPKKQELADDFAHDAGAVFRLTDGKLTLIRPSKGKAFEQLPAEFAAPKGSGLLLLEFERAK